MMGYSTDSLSPPLKESRALEILERPPLRRENRLTVQYDEAAAGDNDRLFSRALNV